MMRLIRSAAALSILAAAATACAPAVPGAVNPSPSPSASTGNGGNQPGEQPGSPSPTVSPTATPDAGLSTTATLSGMVYNEMGMPVSNGTIKVASLNAAKPFTADAPIVSGAYVINNLPEGILLQVTATKDGWTSRAQTAVMVPTRDANKINFGGAGNAYFIAEYPEIEAVEPMMNAIVDATKVTYKLRLSEALDDTNKRRFESAIRLLPADAAANGGAAPTDIEAAEDAGYPYDLTVENASGVSQISSYAIQRGTTFMGDANRRAKVTWDADGRTAILEFDAPLLASKDGEAKYQLALVSNGERITDKDGKQLGTDASGSFSAYPAAGKLILAAFKPEALALKTITGLTAGGEAERWAATHANVGTFKLKKDDVAPTLSGIEVAKLDNATRIELTFSEPMAAHNGTTNGAVNASVSNLANYSFAIGATSDAIKDVKLDGTADTTVDASAAASFGASGDRAKEFKFTNGVTVTVDPLDAKRVFLTINKPNFFNVEARDIKVRVAGVADPAGNTASAAGETNTKLGTL
ncbi:hypothetical protein D3C72_1005470 [compost metagenome]